MSLYEEWLMKHSKSYNALEKEKRFQIFKDNLQYMQYMGRKNRSYNLELNQFADMTNVEFCASVLMFQKIKKTSVRKILLRLFNICSYHYFLVVR